MSRTPYWADTNVNTVVTLGTQNNIDLMSSLTADEMRGTTIVRTIIKLNLFANPMSGVEGGAKLDQGIAVLDVDAFTAGAVPDPVNNVDRPPRGWLWRQSNMVFDDSTRVIPGTILREDIRSKRKLDGGKLILIQDGTAIMGAVFPIGVVGIIRILYLLP